MSSKISMDEARHVAKLARLAVDDGKLETMRAQLEGILGYVAALEQLDTSAVPPTTQAIAMDCPLRPDVVKDSLARSELLAAAPAHEAFGFAVPKVMDGE